MRIVLDSSVLVAASISRAGVCAQLLEDVLTYHDWSISTFIIDEVSNKLDEKFKFPKKDIADLCRFLRTTARLVVPAELNPPVCRDPKDDPVLGTAVAAEAHLLISVDKDLLVLGTFRGVDIVKPGEFWKRLESRLDQQR